MKENDTLKSLSREQLEDLVRLYCKNWLAMDGVWFQSIEQAYGMKTAMEHDVQVWSRFTVIEAAKLKSFLGLSEHPGLDGLEQALRLRLYAHINEDQVQRDGNRLLYRMVQCRVQTARSRKGLEWHPCKEVGVVEYGDFAKTIDDRISCRCLSCYPDVTDPGCCCSWEFTLNP